MLPFLLLGPNLSLVNLIIVSIVCLGLLGLFQRSALAYYMDNAIGWIIASPAAAVVGIMTMQDVSAILLGHLQPAFYWAFAGMIYGAITGAVIVSLGSAPTKRAEQ